MYSVLEGCLSVEAIDRMREKCDELLGGRREMNCGGNRQIVDMSFEGCFAGYMEELERKLQSSYKIFVSSVLNYDLRGGLQLITALSGGRTNQNWHRDVESGFSYAVMIPLVDMDLYNGGIQILPGSERMSVSKIGGVKPVTLRTKKGDVIVFDARLLHRGTRNRSEKDRPVFVTQMENGRYEHGWTEYDAEKDESED